MRFLLVLGIAITVGVMSAPAQVLFNSNGFESPTYAAGALSGQNGWIVDNGTNYQVGTFAPFASQIVRVGGGGANDWAYPITPATPTSAQLIRIQADIARSTPSATPSASYAIDVYNAAVSRTARFGLLNNAGVIQTFVTAPFNTVTGQFDPTQPALNVFFGAAVPADTFVNFDARLNYTTKSFQLSINGTDTGFVIPFVGQTHVDYSDADFNVITVAGATDFGYLDNYITSVVPVPEPATTGLVVSAAFAGVVALRRKRRAAVMA